MSILRYPYFAIPGHRLAPMAIGIAINILNGSTSKFLGFVDTGADQTSLSSDILQELGIDPNSLPIVPVGGAEGTTGAGYCDFLKIGFLELPSLRQQHFPNGRDRVPVHFTKGPFHLFGREHFLDRCKATFDGPNGSVQLEF